MKRLHSSRASLCVVVTAAVLVAFVSSSALASGRTVITVQGGGVGEFLDPNPCDGFQTQAPFGESDFAVSAAIHDDGSVHGVFFCHVKDCVALFGRFTQVLGVDRADSPGDQDGVFLVGEAVFADLTVGPELVRDDNGDLVVFPFCVELREGPASGRRQPAGRFFYTDDVVLLGGPSCLDLDDGFDEEVVTKGFIAINFHRRVDDIPFDRVRDCPIQPLPCE